MKNLDVGRYELVIELRDAGGKTVYSSVRDISKVEKSAGTDVRIDGNKNLIVDGEPFFPFGWYSVSSLWYKPFTEAGFNVVPAGSPAGETAVELGQKANDSGVQYR